MEIDERRIITTVIREGNRQPLGSLLLRSFLRDTILQIESHFCKCLWADEVLHNQGIGQFEELDSFAEKKAREKKPTGLSEKSQVALAVLAHTYVYLDESKGSLPESVKRFLTGDFIKKIQIGEQNETQKQCLSDLVEYQKWERLSEICILCAAYSCTNPYVLIVAGRYYLEKRDAEVSTSIGYFICACEINQVHMGICNMLLREFVKRKGMDYLAGSLDMCLESWNKFKRKALAR